MFGFKSKKNNNPIVETNDLIEVRSYYGNAFHFRYENDNTTLCGKDVWVDASSRRVIDADALTRGWANQHASWYWCQDCASKVPGFTIPVQ